MISFNSENGKLVQVRNDLRKEDTEMIQIFKLDTLVELTVSCPHHRW
jgi:hypothetical protein